MENPDCSNDPACRLDSCVFFTCAKLSRLLGKMAEDVFQPLGFSPSHALLLYAVNERGGIHQKEIGELLHLMPSTITRFIERLETKKLVSRKNEGKTVRLYPTEKGLRMQPEIVSAWNRLHERYADILTPEESDRFLAVCNKLMHALEKRKESDS